MAKKYETTFHGTDPRTAASLQQGHIDVTIGRGELGQGFYLGDQLHVAKAWAWHKHNRSAAVLSVRVARKMFSTLPNIVTLRMHLATPVANPACTFGCDIVRAPIMGGLSSVNSFVRAVTTGLIPFHPRYLYKNRALWLWSYPPMQAKWESNRSQQLINDAATVRTII